MEGLTLKNWTLGKKIGAGACSDVYAGASLHLYMCISVVLSSHKRPVCVLRRSASQAVRH